ncbi:peptide chain release factor 2 [Microbulbifer agarilyticus]|uniref:peptide chain release factor 2 n=1 Tax=Microbulbifer agarilyticus TaxID=260552 RepID=UPI000C1E6F7B|nr:peptide chain release factor 2 [Microbulbifer agarilyticus]MBY6189781.1 peptide chain release factor 2 [Microbulbifer agarilyticus]MBY6211087.1 peptide chain release factor 2 [Microbulbifer agarilyticus]MCA0892312.1 peptide chain release factor 2 [Microbulbifer agarilyticus]MCA0900658.1 peptide chain release factor 2 [Microbulbifer agarilyticus]
MEINPLLNQMKDLEERTDVLRGYLDYAGKKERLTEVELELAEPSVWDEPDRAQELGRERSSLEAVVKTIDDLDSGISDCRELLEMAVEEDDEDSVEEVSSELGNLQQQLETLEFRRMFSGETDPNNAYLDIQAGSGGTEAQDWAEMLLRMYLRWGEAHGFKTTLEEASAGEVAGIKSATIHFQGEYAFGWLRTETGVHRLVRKSPFDSGNRRHTSFTSVFVSPEIDDNIEIEVDKSQVREDTYRASGAGGQHVNKTDSAVRLTHIESGIVVACQSERSQHQNRDKAWKMLRAKLYEQEMQKRNAEKQAMEESKSDIGWGSQIRSYVLDDQRIKDLRTSVQTSNCQAVLDGDLDQFIEASLKAGL